MLSSIHLLAIAKEKNFKKYGIDTMKNLVQDIKKLVSKNKAIIKSTKLCAIQYIRNVDTYLTSRGSESSTMGLCELCLQTMGGLKESCSAYRLCGHCMATRATAKSLVQQTHVTQVEPLTYQHCS